MANIPIRNIPGGVVASPRPSDRIAIDNGISKQQTTIANSVNSSLPVVSQAEAELGINNYDRMTAMRTKQSIAKEAGVSIASIVQAVPTGGLTNQVLTKKSNLDNDLAWVNVDVDLDLGYTPANVAGDSFTGPVVVKDFISSTGVRSSLSPGSVNNGGLINSAFSDAGFFSRLVTQEIVGSTIRGLIHVSDGGATNAFFIFGSDGSLLVPGTISKGAGTFLIDHPLDPYNRDLAHGFVEAPRYDLIYRGVAELVDGRASVDIDEASDMTPGTFAALTTNAVVSSLQNQQGFARVRPEPIDGGRFEIVCEDGESNDRVAWVVIAERNDAFVNSDLDGNTDENGRFIPEREKEIS